MNLENGEASGCHTPVVVVVVVVPFPNPTMITCCFFGLWDCQDFPPEASSLENVQGDSAGDDGVESRGLVECDGESSSKIDVSNTAKNNHPQYPNGNTSES